jgi:hypothetical protein
MPRYFAFGLNFASELELPELGSSDVNTHATPDVEIRLESVAISQTTIGYLGMQICVVPPDIFLDMPDIGRFCVSEGRVISVEPDRRRSMDEIRVYLLGSVLGALFYQRGYLPLHANAIVSEGAAIAFAGPSGAGKSTLAAYFQNRGFNVLCDDVCLIDFSDDGTGFCWPGLRRLKLREDSLSAFGKTSAEFPKIGEGFDKFSVPITGNQVHGPFSLKRIYILREPGSQISEDFQRLTGSDALNAIVSNLYRRRFGELFDPLRMLKQVTVLLQHVEVFAAGRRWGLDSLQSEGLRLERHIVQG